MDAKKKLILRWGGGISKRYFTDDWGFFDSPQESE